LTPVPVKYGVGLLGSVESWPIVYSVLASLKNLTVAATDCSVVLHTKLAAKRSSSL